MHSSDVRAKQFSTGPTGILRILSERFDAGEVDALLERCAAALEAVEFDRPSTVDPAEIVTTQFSMTRFGRGYDPDEVDDYLDEVVVALRGNQE